MKKIICEVCSSNNIKKFDEEFKCLDCGVAYSLESAKKLLVEIEEEVVSNTIELPKVELPKVDNNLDLARKAYSENKFDTAQKYYNNILSKDPNNWEAIFFTTLCSAFQCRAEQLSLHTEKVTQTTEYVLNVIEQIEDLEEKITAFNDVIYNVVKFTLSAYSKADVWFQVSFFIKGPYRKDMVNLAYPSVVLTYFIANKLEPYMAISPALAQSILYAWQTGLDIHSKLLKLIDDKPTHQKIIKSYIDKLACYGVYVTIS